MVQKTSAVRPIAATGETRDVGATLFLQGKGMKTGKGIDGGSLPEMKKENVTSNVHRLHHVFGKTDNSKSKEEP